MGYLLFIMGFFFYQKKKKMIAQLKQTILQVFSLQQNLFSQKPSLTDEENEAVDQ